MSIIRNIVASEARSSASLENPSVSLTDARAFNLVFGGDGRAFSGEMVNEASAMGVPAVRCAVNMISGTLAYVPMQLFKRTDDGLVKSTSDPLYRLVHAVVNDNYMTSFAWRKWMISRYLLGGRAFSFIERNGAGKVTNLWPLDPSRVEVKRVGWTNEYHYSPPNAPKVIYKAGEVIDLCSELGQDGIQHVNPIQTNKNTIGLAIAAFRYSSKIFLGGGVPALAMTGPFESPASAAVGSQDIAAAIQRMTEEERNVLGLPDGFTLNQIGFDPQKSQLVETLKYTVIDIARMFNIPPTLLHDLTFGTYSNTEQQWDAFVKGTLGPIIEMFEQEINAKFFSDAGNRKNYVELNLDGLLRGDFESRMTGYQSAIFSGVLTPNEARQLENRPDMPGGDQLYMQSGTVPVQGLPGYSADSSDVDVEENPQIDPGEGDVTEDDDPEMKPPTAPAAQAPTANKPTQASKNKRKGSGGFK